MTIYSERRAGTTFLEDEPAPFSSDLFTSATQQLLQYGSVSSLLRGGELSVADVGYMTPGGEFIEPDSPMLSAEVARQRVKDAGASLEIPDEGMRERALKIRIDRQQEQTRRNSILSRGPSGIGAGALRLGVSFGAALLDPLDTASAFIPFIGEARYAAMLARAGGVVGRSATRLGVGALEGAAGAALVEPFVYTAARQEQADYDLTDSLFSVALGTALGGGLHMGAGFFGDALKAGRNWRTTRSPEPLPRLLDSFDQDTREAALRTIVSQGLTGREIQVEPVFGRVEPARVAPVDALPPVPANSVRFFHGGVDPTSGGGRFVSPDPNYARDFRRGGEPNPVHYVDIPKSELPSTVFDDVNGIAQNGEIPETFAKQLKPVPSAPPASEVRTAPVQAAAPIDLPRVKLEGSPDWVVQGVERIRAVADQLGITPKIDRLAFEGKTAAQIVKALKNDFPPGLSAQDRKGFVLGTRTSLGIPSQEDRPGFAAWRAEAEKRYAPVARTTPLQASEVQAAAQQSFSPEGRRLVDTEAVRAVDEKVKAAPKDEKMPEVTREQAVEDVTALASALDAERVAKKYPLNKAKPRMPADPELKMPRFPVMNMLKKAGGVKIGSPLAQLLAREDITSLSNPSLFRKRSGLSSADRFPRSENPLFAERGGDEDLGVYISEQEILDAIRDEKFGSPLRTQEEQEKIADFRAQMDVFEGVVREEGPQQEFAPLESYDDLVSRELEPYDELAETADEYGDSLDALGECYVRKGEF